MPETTIFKCATTGGTYFGPPMDEWAYSNRSVSFSRNGSTYCQLAFITRISGVAIPRTATIISCNLIVLVSPPVFSGPTFDVPIAIRLFDVELGTNPDITFGPYTGAGRVIVFNDTATFNDGSPTNLVIPILVPFNTFLGNGSGEPLFCLEIKGTSTSTANYSVETNDDDPALLEVQWIPASSGSGSGPPRRPHKRRVSGWRERRGARPTGLTF